MLQVLKDELAELFRLDLLYRTHRVILQEAAHKGEAVAAVAADASAGGDNNEDSDTDYDDGHDNVRPEVIISMTLTSPARTRHVSHAPSTALLRLTSSCLFR